MKTFLTVLFLAFFVFAANSDKAYAAFPVRHSIVAVVAEDNNTPTVKATPEESTASQMQPSRHHRIRNKSQRWALIICCLVGYLGIHRYYLGYLLEGCIQTVTLGGMGVWWIIDLIRICTGDLQPKDGKYMATF